MKNRSKASISQCMIVKNEEDKIEKALSWGKGIVSEQIVVDTGSTDRTVEIAEAMGAKIYHFEWIDDFSAARNFAISKAKYEWIAFLDADEYFLEEDARKLLYYVQRLQNNRKYDVILTSWVHLENDGRVLAVGTQTRIFRNVPGLRYKNRIHENVAPVGNYPYLPVDAVSELAIYHTGYGKIENNRKTGSQRNLKMIQKELEDNPDNYDMLGYLGDEYYSMDELDKAEEAFRKAVSLMPEGQLSEYDIRSVMTFEKLLAVLRDKANVEESVIMEVYQKATEKLPKEADFDYTVGQYFLLCSDFPKAEKHLKRALQILEENGATSKSMMLSGRVAQAYELLATCCYNNGNLVDCVNYTMQLLKTDKYLMNTLFLMLTAFRVDESSGRKGAADAMTLAAFLGNNLYDFNSLKDRLFVLKAAIRAEYASLVQVVRGLFTPEELASVDRALSAPEQ